LQESKQTYSSVPWRSATQTQNNTGRGSAVKKRGQKLYEVQKKTEKLQFFTRGGQTLGVEDSA